MKLFYNKYYIMYIIYIIIGYNNIVVVGLLLLLFCYCGLAIWLYNRVVSSIEIADYYTAGESYVINTY